VKEEPTTADLPEDFRQYFWDYDWNRLSWERSRYTIVLRLIEVGDTGAIRWLRERMTDDEICDFIIRRRGRGISPPRLRLWSLLVGVPSGDIERWIQAARRNPWYKRTHSASESGGEVPGGRERLDADKDLLLGQIRLDILKRAGGTLDTAEVANLLGTTADEVRRRLEAGRLLAYQTVSGEYRFPRVQFTDNGVLPGLEQVLDAMNIDAAWMRVQLLMDHDVIGALRDGRVEEAVLAASSYLPGEERRG
jgi:hypothetical protein